MLLYECKEQADRNWEDINEIIDNSDCWGIVNRYDIDSCHLIRKDNGEIVWEGTTGSVLKILEDTCEIDYISPRRKMRKMERLYRELRREIESL